MHHINKEIITVQLSCKKQKKLQGGSKMRKFYSTQKIGDIVADFPKASDLFMEYRIDFSCGGNRPLKEVLEESGLNED